MSNVVHVSDSTLVHVAPLQAGLCIVLRWTRMYLIMYDYCMLQKYL